MNIIPIHVRSPLFAEPTGRPGEWWEPTSIPASDVAAGLRTESDRRRLPFDLLVALLIERALVLRDVSDCGIGGTQARSAITVARNALALAGPGRLHTPYVNMLRNGERDYEPESIARIGQRDLILPLRLHEAARNLRLDETCRADSVDEAVDWEIAAATSGQFMREWALATLLSRELRPH